MTTMTRDGQVEFRFYRAQASHVTIAGTFNAWQQDSVPMEPLGDGWWIATVSLSPGEYHFRYLVDGEEWFTDFAANGVHRSRWGWESLLIVPASASLQHEPQTLRIAA